MNDTLSILIPARNEVFLKDTIEDILRNKEGNTEVIAILDGAWANPPIEDHPDVTLIYLPEAVGQRAATNLACSMSRSKYVMKLDAHCAFDKGFDRKLMETWQDDWTTVVPAQYNLHAFNWKCLKCGKEWYQGQTPTFCCSDQKGKIQNTDCDGKEFEKVMKWKRRNGTLTCKWYFDSEKLKFGYWPRSDLKDKKAKTPIETMSLLGACWMIKREDYWRLNICDEEHGSWGQQGTEIACKTWLSGGKLICNRVTWFAHMFRTQGGDFGFPYKQSSKQVSHARNYSDWLFRKGNWDLAVHDLEWLVKKFNPPTWS